MLKSHLIKGLKQKKNIKTQRINMKNHRFNPDCRVKINNIKLQAQRCKKSSMSLLWQILPNWNFYSGFFKLYFPIFLSVFQEHTYFISVPKFEKFIREMDPHALKFIQRAPLWAWSQFFIVLSVVLNNSLEYVGSWLYPKCINSIR